ncbi:mycothiol biosynthesis acetyltransferase, partial [mine drainage metagenome]
MEELIIALRSGEEEISNIAKLVSDAESFDKHKALGDHSWLDLVHGGRKGVWGFTARTINSEGLVGYAQISVGNDSWALELVVHPMARNEKMGVSHALVQRSLGEIAKHGGGHVHVWLSNNNSQLERVLIEAGFVAGRQLIQMRRPLPLEDWHSQTKIDTRPFVVGKDDEKWLHVNNRAFANHPEQGGWTHETLSMRQKEPWFDGSGFLLHFVDEELAAFCWTKVHGDSSPRMGEIYVIGVDPKFSGMGIGRKITIAGLQHLASIGMPLAMLYVDAENTN